MQMSVKLALAANAVEAATPASQWETLKWVPDNGITQGDSSILGSNTQKKGDGVILTLQGQQTASHGEEFSGAQVTAGASPGNLNTTQTGSYLFHVKSYKKDGKKVTDTQELPRRMVLGLFNYGSSENQHDGCNEIDVVEVTDWSSLWSTSENVSTTAYARNWVTLWSNSKDPVYNDNATNCANNFARESYVAWSDKKTWYADKVDSTGTGARVPDMTTPYTDINELPSHQANKRASVPLDRGYMPNIDCYLASRSNESYVEIFHYASIGGDCTFEGSAPPGCNVDDATNFGDHHYWGESYTNVATGETKNNFPDGQPTAFAEETTAAAPKCFHRLFKTTAAYNMDQYTMMNLWWQSQATNYSHVLGDYRDGSPCSTTATPTSDTTDSQPHTPQWNCNNRETIADLEFGKLEVEVAGYYSKTVITLQESVSEEAMRFLF